MHGAATNDWLPLPRRRNWRAFRTRLSRVVHSRRDALWLPVNDRTTGLGANRYCAMRRYNNHRMVVASYRLDGMHVALERWFQILLDDARDQVAVVNHLRERIGSGDLHRV